MKLSQVSIFLLFLFSTLGSGASAQIVGHRRLDRKYQRYINGITKLFVFGDSYADTGNVPKGVEVSWKSPYGITFPGEPTGRFSDGRVLTDYVAKFYGLKSPVPYRIMKNAGYNLRYGVNFAYGGTGVFDTWALYPNMTTQIDFFEELLNKSVFTKKDLETSLFLLSVAGNDYTTYKNSDNHEGLPAFAKNTVNQIVANIKRLHGVGARKIAVTTITLIGCLPHYTIIYTYQQCNDSTDTIMSIHNDLLLNAVGNLNNDYKDSSFTVLDLFSSFTTGFFDNGDSPGSSRFENPLKPCCMGIRDGYYCGSVDSKGEKMYTVCEDRGSAFFWDDLHPTQAGWHAVYRALRSTLQSIR